MVKYTNPQQRKLASLQEQAANAKDPKEHQRISQKIADIMSEPPKKRS